MSCENVFFVKRVKSILPNNVVTANNLGTFKNRLKIFLNGQEVLYNREGDSKGIGSRITRV